MDFLLVSLIIFAYPVLDASGQYYDAPQSSGGSLTVAWRTTDYANNFTMNVKEFYSSRHNSLRWEINDESYVIWSLNEQMLRYFYPMRFNGNDMMIMNEVENPFGMTQPANIPLFPDLRNYQKFGEIPPYSVWVRNVYWTRNPAKCTVVIRQDEQVGTVIQNVTYEETLSGKRIITEYYLFQFGEPEESKWTIREDVAMTSHQTGSRSIELIEELMTKKYLMGIGLIWPDEITLVPRMVPQTMLGHGQDHTRSLRQYSQCQSPFPFSQPQYDSYRYPAFLDWSRCGKVSDVKDQNMCSACSTFAAVDALQSAYFINSGSWVDMSIQAVIDCSWGDRRWKPHVNAGCFQGFVDATFDWVCEKRGIPTTEQYGPFKGVNGKCKLPVQDDGSFDLVAPIVSYSKVPSSVNAMKMALLHGPVPVSLTLPEIADYRPGYSGYIITSTPELNASLAHAGLVVGYGFDQNQNIGYWIVKNSWGRDWGLRGYFYVGMTSNNPLRLLDEAYYVNMVNNNDFSRSYCNVCGCSY